jgi:GNAT superfamily N-acetyltransferase
MREIGDYEEFATLCGDDTLCLWAAQGLDGRCRAWRSADGRAVAVAAPALAARDRLVVRGPADAAVGLARDALDLIGPSYRPLGDRDLIGAVVDGVPRLAGVGSFGWMHCWRPAALPAAPATARRLPGATRCLPGTARRLPGAASCLPGAARWLPGAALPEVAAFLEASFPASLAKPETGAERWAGVRDQTGRLVATGTLAWSAPSVALLAGIAVHPQARGQGLGRGIAAFLLAEGLHRHEAAALMVDDRNHTARHLYRSLGLRYQPVAAAALTG